MSEAYRHFFTANGAVELDPDWTPFAGQFAHREMRRAMAERARLGMRGKYVVPAKPDADAAGDAPIARILPAARWRNGKIKAVVDTQTGTLYPSLDSTLRGTRVGAIRVKDALARSASGEPRRWRPATPEEVKLIATQGDSGGRYSRGAA